MTIGGNGNGTYSATSCAARVDETITCTATYTPTNTDVAGTYTETATFSGDVNYTASSSPETNNFTIGSNVSTTTVTSGLNPSTYGRSVTFTATITSDTSDVKRRKPGKNGIRPMQPTGTVTWSANTGCTASTLTGSYPGVATCTTSSLGGGSDTVTATYPGDSNHSSSSGSVNQTVNPASQTIIVTTPAPATAAKTQLHGGGERHFRVADHLHECRHLHQRRRCLHDDVEQRDLHGEDERTVERQLHGGAASYRNHDGSGGKSRHRLA